MGCAPSPTAPVGGFDARLDDRYEDQVFYLKVLQVEAAYVEGLSR